jgi:Holliday junction resolvasome RuvABC ATP-dependent DNA helicase subunit
MGPEQIDRELPLDDLILPEKTKRQIFHELNIAKRMRNTLALTGTGGLGKTSVGMAIARQIPEVQKVILVASAPVRAEQDEILDHLNQPIPTFLLLDEIHSYANQTWLLNTLEGGRGINGDFFVFGATTNRGAVPQTVMSRFPVKLMIAYSRAEEVLILRKRAELLGIDFKDDEEMKIVLRAASGNPRTMNTILGFWGASNPDEAVYLAELTPDGLDPDCVRMLRHMYSCIDRRKHFGRKTLELALGAPGGINDIEGILTRKGYIEQSPQGLSLTPNGTRRAVQLEKELKSV